MTFNFDEYCRYLIKNEWGIEERKKIGRELRGFLNCLFFNDLISVKEYDLKNDLIRKYIINNEKIVN